MPLASILHDWWTGGERSIRYRQLRNYGTDPKLARQARDFSPSKYGKIHGPLLCQFLIAQSNSTNKGGKSK